MKILKPVLMSLVITAVLVGTVVAVKMDQFSVMAAGGGQVGRVVGDSESETVARQQRAQVVAAPGAVGAVQPRGDTSADKTLLDDAAG